MKLPKLKRGDIVIVHWLDITGSDGMPDRVSLAQSQSLGYYYEQRKSQGLDCIVTTRSKNTDKDMHEWDGADIYPLSVVTRVERVR